MTRLFIASIVGAIGYLLLYAGVADAGRFALRPWDALTQATNTPSSNGGSSSSSNGGGGGGVLGTLENLGGGVLSNLPGLP